MKATLNKNVSKPKVRAMIHSTGEVYLPDRDSNRMIVIKPNGESYLSGAIFDNEVFTQRNNPQTQFVYEGDTITLEDL